MERARAFWKYHLGWMCCNTGHNINLVAFHPGRPYGPYQITILRHQVHTMVIMIINSIIKIVTIFINILNILISSMMMMMMKSGGFSYGGFSYILCSYILRSYFGCTPRSASSTPARSSSSRPTRSSSPSWGVRPSSVAAASDWACQRARGGRCPSSIGGGQHHDHCHCDDDDDNDDDDDEQIFMIQNKQACIKQSQKTN